MIVDEVEVNRIEVSDVVIVISIICLVGNIWKCSKIMFNMGIIIKLLLIFNSLVKKLILLLSMV